MLEVEHDPRLFRFNILDGTDTPFKMRFCIVFPPARVSTSNQQLVPGFEEALHYLVQHTVSHC